MNAEASTSSHSVQKPFLADLEAIRRRAREHLQDGAVTEGYGADLDTVLKVLNEALATEIVCVLRYTSHYYLASGLNAEAAAEEFLEHAGQEQEHANKLAERITQLGGKPNLSPAGLLTRSHTEFVQPEQLQRMIEENLVAERVAIDIYREFIQYLGNDDPTTRKVIEEILAVEEEHAEDMSTLLTQFTH